MLLPFRLPSSFNYTKSIKHRGQLFKYRMRSESPEEYYPMGVTEYMSGFSSMIRFVPARTKPINKTFDRNHHKNFIFQGLNYLIHSPFELFSKDSAVHQSILNHSMVVYLNPQKTIIDKTLEDSEPQRFEVICSKFFLQVKFSDVDVTWKMRNR